MKCPKCNERLNKLPCGKKWHCVSCRESYFFSDEDIEKHAAEREAEPSKYAKRVNVTEELMVELEASIASGLDYIDLEPQLRDDSEKAFNRLLLKSLRYWTDTQAKFYRLWVSFPGRGQYVSARVANLGDPTKSDSATLRKIASSLELLCNLSNAQVEALGGDASNLGAIKAATTGSTVSGLRAAKEAGDDFADAIDGMFG